MRIPEPEKLALGQITSEGNQFLMPEEPMLDNARIMKNLLELTSPYPYLPESFPSKALCSFDIHTLLSYVNQYRVRAVTEFGFGVSTAILSLMGVRTRAFSLDVSDQGKKHFVGKKMGFTACDLMDPEYREQIYASCLMSDLIVIDCLHSYQMAEYYYEHFLSRTKKPIYLHDMYNFNRKDKQVTGEQTFWMDRVVGKDYQVFTGTDMLNEYRKQVCEKLGVVPEGKGMGRCCAMILHPL